MAKSREKKMPVQKPSLRSKPELKLSEEEMRLGFAEIGFKDLRRRFRQARDKYRFVENLWHPKCPECGYYVLRSSICGEEEDAAQTNQQDG